MNIIGNANPTNNWTLRDVPSTAVIDVYYMSYRVARTPCEPIICWLFTVIRSNARLVVIVLVADRPLLGRINSETPSLSRCYKSSHIVDAK